MVVYGLFKKLTSTSCMWPKRVAPGGLRGSYILPNIQLGTYLGLEEIDHLEEREFET